jgi:hypothetical protein
VLRLKEVEIMKKMRMFLVMAGLTAITIAGMFSLSFAQEKSKETAPIKPATPLKPDIRGERPGAPSLPDLIIVGVSLRLDRPPFFAFSGTYGMDGIIVPFRFRIENRGNADAGRFRISIMQQPVSPPGPETEAMVEGDRYINGLRPTALYPTEGVGFYNFLWNVVFPRGMAGQRVRISAIIDSGNEVRESDETLNRSQWLEVQLPAEAMTPGMSTPPWKELPKIKTPVLPEKPDLSVDISGRGLGHLTDLYPDNPGMGPDTFFVRGMVFNGGGAAVSARCEVDIFLSKDTKVSPDDRLMGRIVIAETIPPKTPGRYGSVLIRKREYSIIGIPAGTYYICARVDPRNRIEESNETNNDDCDPSAIRIHEAGSRR